MPCSDVTEIIHVELDADDCLQDYYFSKRSCGQGVGSGNLLMDQLRGWSMEKLLTCDAEQYLAECPEKDELLEFLNLKHFFAIQSVLEVLTGKEPGGKNDPCAAAEISYGDGTLVIDGQIAVDLVTEKIKSCGGCKSCGTGKKPKVVFN